MADNDANIPEVTLYDPHWVRTRGDHYHRLLLMDPARAGLEGLSGVYVVWHSGLRPRWIFVGKSPDLAATLLKLANDEEIKEYEVHGGIFVTWAPIRDEHQDGVLHFLHTIMKPLIANPEAPRADVVPIPVYAPKAATAAP